MHQSARIRHINGSRRRLAAATLVVAIGAIATNATVAQGATVAHSPAAVTHQAKALAVATSHSGYRMLGADGSVYGFGTTQHFSLRAAGAVALTNKTGGSGYWVATAFGGVYAYGSAANFGSKPALQMGETISTISATPSGRGYWLFSNRGRVFPYGNAKFYGDLSHVALQGPIVASVATPTGHGYYLVGSDGGVFSYGDAKFRGSMGGKHLVAPIVGIAATPDNHGYWEVASDGGVFAFRAPFRGSMGAKRLNRPVTGLVAFGNGYLMVGTDGGVFDFSNKPFLGSLGGRTIPAPIVGIASFTATGTASTPPPGSPPPTTDPTTPTTTRGSTTTTVPVPPPDGFPTPQNTGWAPTGVTLSTYTGPQTITTNGTTIDSADIPFALTIKASNVTISRSRISGVTADSYVVEQMGGSTNLTLRNVEVLPRTATDHPDRAIASFGSTMTLDHVYVHGTQRGIQTGNYTTVVDSYSDNFYNSTQNHATAVMSLGGTQHVTLQHNTFGCDTGECSSAMSVYPQTDFGGANNDWTINQNLFEGGSYCVYLGYSPADGESPNTNMRVTNNFFGVKYHPTCGIYGPVGSWYAGTGDTWTNNTWYAPGTSKNGTVVKAS